MKLMQIDKVDSSIYKGIAILLIAIHNFMHLVKPLPRQNEFYFNVDRFYSFLNLIVYDFQDVIRVSFSYLGHYGVQIFIFLSAYGLTKKYTNGVKNYWSFLFSRISKIYPAFILSILLLLVLQFLVHGSQGVTTFLIDSWEAILLKLLFISNFVPDMAKKPIGPWWFISFIVQFYVVFPLMLRAYNKFGGFSLLLMAIFGLAVNIGLDAVGINSLYSVIGHLPEFCLGIYLAKQNELNVSWLLFLVFFVLFLLGNLFKTFWFLSHLSILILMLPMLQFLSKKIKKVNLLLAFFSFFGSISMYLFFVNGFMRNPLLSWAIQYDNWLMTLIFCLAFIVLVTVASLILKYIEKLLRNLVHRWTHSY